LPFFKSLALYRAVLASPFRNDDVGKEWREHRTYKLEEIEVVRPGHGAGSGAPAAPSPASGVGGSLIAGIGGIGGHHGSRAVEVKMGSGAQAVTRDVKFETPDDAAGFERLLAKLRDREKARAQRKVAQYRELQRERAAAAGKKKKEGAFGGGLALFEASESSANDGGRDDGDATERGEGSAGGGVGGDDTIHLLVEIVSATDLPVADLASTDPFVVVLMGGRQVHKTKVVSKTLDPIWTLRKGSLFLLSMTPEAFFSCSSGMTFCLKDYDAVGSNDVLGQVVVGLDELLASTGERVGYDVALEKNFRDSLKDPKKQTKLYLRIKEASRSDIEVRARGLIGPVGRLTRLPCSLYLTRNSPAVNFAAVHARVPKRPQKGRGAFRGDGPAHRPALVQVPEAAGEAREPDDDGKRKGRSAKTRRRLRSAHSIAR
jgi:hypothetical protein